MVDTKAQGVVYTAVFGGKDELRPPLYDWQHDWPECRFVRFTDAEVSPDHQGWENVVVPLEGASGRRASRLYKTMPHKHFPDAPWSIWVDGTHEWREDPAKLASDILRKVDIATFGHYFDAETEHGTICQNYPAEAETFKAQKAAYQAEGFDYSLKVRMGGFIFRNHVPSVAAFNEAWWAELEKWSMRDQIPLTYVLWKTKLVCGALGGDPYYHAWFRYSHHDGKKGTCYPEWWGKWPKNVVKRMREAAPYKTQLNWFERPLNKWLSWWHGDEPDEQYKYYRCQACHKIVSWKQLHTLGSCSTCGVATKVSPTRIGAFMLLRLLLTPWTVK